MKKLMKFNDCYNTICDITNIITLNSLTPYNDSINNYEIITNLFTLTYKPRITFNLLRREEQFSLAIKLEEVDYMMMKENYDKYEEDYKILQQAIGFNI